jgi:hypothetical protein
MAGLASVPIASFPQDPSSLSTWQRQVSLLAERAMNSLMEKIPNPPKRITPAYLLKARIDWDNPDSPSAKSLPKDTPNAILAHFGFDMK